MLPTPEEPELFPRLVKQRPAQGPPRASHRHLAAHDDAVDRTADFEVLATVPQKLLPEFKPLCFVTRQLRRTELLRGQVSVPLLGRAVQIGRGGSELPTNLAAVQHRQQLPGGDKI